MRGVLERGQYLEEHELVALLRAAYERRRCNARRDHALLALLANTGIRPGEAINLIAAECRLTDHDPLIRVRRLKKRRERGVIDDLRISRPLARTLRLYIADAGITPAARLFAITVRTVENVFRYYARRAGLDPRYRLYSLRHTALSRAYQHTGDIRLVQELAGHASVNTTQIYAHVSAQQKRRVADDVGNVV